MIKVDRKNDFFSVKNQIKLIIFSQKSRCHRLKNLKYLHIKIEILINIHNRHNVQQYINTMHGNYLILKEYRKFKPVGICKNSNYLI